MSERLCNPEIVDDVNGFGLGQRLRDHKGQEHMYVMADAALAASQACAIAADYGAAPITNALHSGATLVGVANVAIAKDKFGWLMIYGQRNLLVKASCAAGVALFTSATAGSLDDTATSRERVYGIALTAARTSSDGVANARIMNPRGVQ